MSASIDHVTPHLANASQGTGKVKTNSGDFATLLADVTDTGESRSRKPPNVIPIGEPPVGVPPPGSAGLGRGSIGSVGGERPGDIEAIETDLPVIPIGMIDFDTKPLPLLGPVGPPSTGSIESAEVPSGAIDGKDSGVHVIPIGTLPVIEEVPKPGEAGVPGGRISEAWRLLAQLQEEMSVIPIGVPVTNDVPAPGEWPGGSGSLVARASYHKPQIVPIGIMDSKLS